MNPLHACRLLVLVSISLMVSLSYAADPRQVQFVRDKIKSLTKQP